MFFFVIPCYSPFFGKRYLYLFDFLRNIFKTCCLLFPKFLTLTLKKEHCWALHGFTSFVYFLLGFLKQSLAIRNINSGWGHLKDIQRLASNSSSCFLEQLSRAALVQLVD